MNYKIGDNVWVKCVGTDVWARGRVIKLNAKTIRVYNTGRGLEGNYSPNNVKDYYLDLGL